MITCIHTNSSCYKLKGGYSKSMVGRQPRYGLVYPADMRGIVVHSTGVNNTSLKRWVQPSKDDPNYDELIKKIGLNKNGNSWNRDVNKAVHYVIGKLADGTIETVQIMPEDICAWGVGSGSKGSYNYAPAYIQFEICEDDLSSAEYFLKVYNEAVQLCVKICKEHGWNSQVIIDHREAHKLGYGSNHGDITHWLKKYGKTMTDFRDSVQKELDKKPIVPLKEGDKIEFTGDTQYSNSKKLIGRKATRCIATIERIVNAKHPYLIKGSGVYGWVNAEDIKRI